MRKDVRAEGRPYDAIKRILDVIGALALLVLTAPIQVAVGVVILLRLGRPVLFRQARPGLNGVPFELVKFRTMRDPDRARGIVTNSDRITPLGQRLRAWSLDELPSLWNVLRGDLSLVGPRPLLMQYLPFYTPEQARRHEVRPGLTGLAQVNGRNALNWRDRFILDVKYVDDRSLMLDLNILLRTTVKVLQREGINSAGSVVGAPFTNAWHSPRSTGSGPESHG